MLADRNKDDSLRMWAYSKLILLKERNIKSCKKGWN